MKVASVAIPEQQSIWLGMNWMTAAYVMHLAEQKLNDPNTMPAAKVQAEALLRALEGAFEATIEDLGEDVCDAF